MSLVVEGKVLSIHKADQRKWTADYLRQIAGRVESGEISNIATTFVLEDGGMGRFHSMIDDRERPFLLIAGLSTLQFRLQSQVERDDTNEF